MGLSGNKVKITTFDCKDKMLTKFETKSARVKGKISLAAGSVVATASKSTTKCF